MQDQNFDQVAFQRISDDQKALGQSHRSADISQIGSIRERASRVNWSVVAGRHYRFFRAQDVPGVMSQYLNPDAGIMLDCKTNDRPLMTDIDPTGLQEMLRPQEHDFAEEWVSSGAEHKFHDGVGAEWETDVYQFIAILPELLERSPGLIDTMLRELTEQEEAQSAVGSNRSIDIQSIMDQITPDFIQDHATLFYRALIGQAYAFSKQAADLLGRLAIAHGVDRPNPHRLLPDSVAFETWKNDLLDVEFDNDKNCDTYFDPDLGAALTDGCLYMLIEAADLSGPERAHIDAGQGTYNTLDFANIDGQDIQAKRRRLAVLSNASVHIQQQQLAQSYNNIMQTGWDNNYVVEEKSVPFILEDAFNSVVAIAFANPFDAHEAGIFTIKEHLTTWYRLIHGSLFAMQVRDNDLTVGAAIGFQRSYCLSVGLFRDNPEAMQVTGASLLSVDHTICEFYWDVRPEYYEVAIFTALINYLKSGHHASASNSYNLFHKLSSAIQLEDKPFAARECNTYLVYYGTHPASMRLCYARARWLSKNGSLSSAITKRLNQPGPGNVAYVQMSLIVGYLDEAQFWDATKMSGKRDAFNDAYERFKDQMMFYTPYSQYFYGLSKEVDMRMKRDMDEVGAAVSGYLNAMPDSTHNMSTALKKVATEKASNSVIGSLSAQYYLRAAKGIARQIGERIIGKQFGLSGVSSE